MWLLKRHGHKPFFTRPARIAPHIMGGSNSILLNDETLHIALGSIIINAVGIRSGAAYRAASGEFVWRSRDGLASGTNITSFVGGGLVSAGNKGTLIRLVPNSEPLPTNVYIEDEDL